MGRARSRLAGCLVAALAGVPTGWTKLPAPPEPRVGAAVVWTGASLIAWGGCTPSAADGCGRTVRGFAFDPVARSWARIPAAPLAAASADAVWTGAEAIFLHRVNGRLGGQAYNPRSRTWRVLASAPIAARDGAVRVWTGAELIVWGGGRRDRQAARTGAAYDPARDVWRPIARAPLGLNLASGMWTGRELVVFGSLLDSYNRAETRVSVGAAYDPATDSWRRLRPSRLSPQATSAVWVSGRIVAWDYELRSQVYDTARDRWSVPARMPLDFMECYPDSVAVREYVFAFFCGRAALYDTRWRELRGGPLTAPVQSQSASLVPAGDAVFLAMSGADASVAYWAYRPPR